ncbi:MAG TPA: 5'/3'-nucleotidase SurE [Acidimicrobiia bacterium]|nr:5'/3'-nucleotidase SurE [Acidimicrobiia bacterium]
MRVVLTNDDGITATGIHALCRRLCADGHEVTVVAPDTDRSGASAAIGRLTPGRGVPAERVDDFPVAGVVAYRITGPPGLAVMSACLGAFGPAPEVVVSGINAGPNTGQAVLFSGTVGAALTAQTFGVSALAVSVDDTRPWHWDTACHYAGPTLRWLVDRAPGTVLNLNVPGVEASAVRGFHWASLDRFGSVRLAGYSRGEVQFELRETETTLDPHSDTALLADGFATLTSLTGVSIASGDGAAGPVTGLELRPRPVATAHR